MGSRAEYDAYDRVEEGWGRDPGYNAVSTSGKLPGDNNFTIDGKSWAYRDPYNREKINRDSAGDDNYYGFKGTGKGNEDSYAMTNVLYDYDYGSVRDAAKELGIKNVNEQKEVDELMEYLTTPRASQADHDRLAENYDGLRGDFDTRNDQGGASGDKYNRNFSFNEAMGSTFGTERATEIARGRVDDEIAKATGGFSDATGAETANDTSSAEAAAQALLKTKIEEVAEDKDKMEQGKFNQGKYVLNNLGGDSYSSGN